MTLDLRSSGDALCAVATDLVRVWRATRFTAGASVFPGVLDGVIEDFLARVGDSLLQGAPPEEAWRATGGVVRVLRHDRSAPLLAAEWALARDVLLSACDALEVAPEAVEAAGKAVDAAAAATEQLLGGAAPARILRVHQLGGFRPRGAAGSRSGGRP